MKFFHYKCNKVSQSSAGIRFETALNLQVNVRRIGAIAMLLLLLLSHFSRVQLCATP